MRLGGAAKPPLLSKAKPDRSKSSAVLLAGDRSLPRPLTLVDCPTFETSDIPSRPCLPTEKCFSHLHPSEARPRDRLSNIRLANIQRPRTPPPEAFAELPVSANPPKEWLSTTPVAAPLRSRLETGNFLLPAQVSFKPILRQKIEAFGLHFPRRVLNISGREKTGIDTMIGIWFPLASFLMVYVRSN